MVAVKATISNRINSEFTYCIYEHLFIIAYVYMYIFLVGDYADWWIQGKRIILSSGTFVEINR